VEKARAAAEFDDALLGPEALISGVLRNEAAMAGRVGARQNWMTGFSLIPGGRE